MKSILLYQETYILYKGSACVSFKYIILLLVITRNEYKSAALGTFIPPKNKLMQNHFRYNISQNPALTVRNLEDQEKQWLFLHLIFSCSKWNCYFFKNKKHTICNLKRHLKVGIVSMTISIYLHAYIILEQTKT